MPAVISPHALRHNPLVTGWDNLWHPTQVELGSAGPLAGSRDEIIAAAQRISPDAGDAARTALDAFAVREWAVPCGQTHLHCRAHTLVMGIVNVTEDSFSDGGRYSTSEAAIAHGLALAEQGADILDIGGESTRPGASPVPADEELRRTEPVVRELARRCGIPLSVDTGKASVAAAALDAGASIVNDVTALGDPEMAAVVARSGAGLILMHMLGEPRTMQVAPEYGNVLGEVAGILRGAMARAAEAGVALERIIVDPGIGFGKTLAHNTEIIRRLPVLASLGRPILMGCSRKSMIKTALGLPVDRRLAASLALNVLSVLGRASIIRVHDVREAVECAAMTDAVLLGKPCTIKEDRCSTSSPNS